MTMFNLASPFLECSITSPDHAMGNGDFYRNFMWTINKRVSKQWRMLWRVQTKGGQIFAGQTMCSYNGGVQTIRFSIFFQCKKKMGFWPKGGQPNGIPKWRVQTMDVQWYESRPWDVQWRVQSMKCRLAFTGRIV